MISVDESVVRMESEGVIMREKSQQNREMLRQLCGAGRVLGWVLVVLFATGFCQSVWMWAFVSPKPEHWSLYGAVMGLTSDYLFVGLLVLVITQFIRFLVEEEYQPGWLLRRGNVILYIFALGLLIRCGVVLSRMANIDTEYQFILLGLLTTILPIFTKVLILIGMGLVLRRVLPVIAESKTLV